MKIPTYGTPQIESAPLPGVRQRSSASPALFGAAAEEQVRAGQRLLDAGTALNEAAIRLQERENADQLFAAETALKDEYLTFEEGLRQRKGQSAWGVTTDTEKWFADQEKKHNGILQNDVQRALFKQSITKLRQSAVNTVSRYEIGERHRSLEESANASIVGSINLAAANAASDLTTAAASGFKLDIIKRVQVLADLNGWTPERKVAEESQHLTNLHLQVIQSMTNRDAARARQYFEANKAEINGTVHGRIGRTLMLGETKQAAFEFAERPDIQQLSEQDALLAARDFFKDEPEKREAAVNEIKTRFIEREQLRERAQRDAADAAWKVFMHHGKLSAIPSHVIASLDGRDWESLKRFADNKLSGKSVKTDFATWYDLNQRIHAGEKVNLLRYADSISASDLKEFADMMTNPAKIKEAATLSQQLATTHNLLKFGEGDKEKKGTFDRAVTDAVSVEQKQKGRALSYEERQAIIDRLVIEGDVNGWLPGGRRRLYEAQGTPAAKKFVADKPTAEMLKLGMAGEETQRSFDAFVAKRIHEAEATRGKPLTDGEKEFITGDAARKWSMEVYFAASPMRFPFSSRSTYGSEAVPGAFMQWGEKLLPGKFIGNKSVEEKHFFYTPEIEAAKVDQALAAYSHLFGDQIEREGGLGSKIEAFVMDARSPRQLQRDAFYSNFVVPYAQFAEATGLPNTPEYWAAFAALARFSKPMTGENLTFILGELGKVFRGEGGRRLQDIRTQLDRMDAR